MNWYCNKPENLPEVMRQKKLVHIEARFERSSGGSPGRNKDWITHFEAIWISFCTRLQEGLFSKLWISLEYLIFLLVKLCWVQDNTGIICNKVELLNLYYFGIVAFVILYWMFIVLLRRTVLLYWRIHYLSFFCTISWIRKKEFFETLILKEP